MAVATRRLPAIGPSLLCAVYLIGLPVKSWAIEFEVDIRIRSEDDLHDLLTQGAISDETHQSLLELLRSGLDLARASEHELYALPGLSQAAARAIVTYREAHGGLPDPERLVHDGILTAAQWESIQPFIQRLAPSDPKSTPADTDAPSSLAPRTQLLFRSQTLLGDPVAPSSLLRGRLALGPNFTAGALLVGRRMEAGAARWSSSHQALFADAPDYRMSIPKFFAAWRAPHTRLLLGNFRIGFGERLTLDTTGLRSPDGAVPDDVAFGTSTSTRLCRYSTTGGARPVCAERGTAHRSVASDVRVPLSFRGIAGSVENLPISRTAVLNAHGFLSYVARPVYQYEILDRRACPPTYSDNARSIDCAAPSVFETGHTDRRLAYLTLQDAFTELATGGNLTVAYPGQAHLGVTGYYASPSWRISGAQVDFQEHSRYPAGGAFGALGLNAIRTFEALSLSAEIARTLDASQSPYGGLGVVVRALAGGRHDETELSLRYFQRAFANPYARPISAPDRIGGLSARDELGARLRLAHSVSDRTRVRASADLWTSAPDSIETPTGFDEIRLHVQARADIEIRPRLPLSIWIEHGNRALGQNGPGLCYDQAATENVADGADSSWNAGATVRARCRGELYQIGCRLAQSSRGRRWYAVLQLTQAFVSDVRYPRRYRQDRRVWGELGARIGRTAHLGAQTSYSDGSIHDDRYLERAWRLTLDASWTPSPGSALHLRSSRLSLLDRRPSTLNRTPNPEYAFTLELEHRF